MLLRRITEHVKAQNWTAVALDFFIVIVGVFIGIQVANWNDVRTAEKRKDEIIAALVTDLEDAITVQEEGIIGGIDAGLTSWRDAHARGGHPAPYYFRMVGSDTAPNTWDMLQQMEISGLFDPVMLFDLNFYYSEQRGVGQKYIRYVTFVEDRVLPFETEDPLFFYTENGETLKPEYRASMDRLQEYREEVQRLSRWAECLVKRLEARTHFELSCSRADASITTVRHWAPTPRKPNK